MAIFHLQLLLSGKVCYPWDFCETRNYDDEKWGSTTTTITKRRRKKILAQDITASGNYFEVIKTLGRD